MNKLITIPVKVTKGDLIISDEDVKKIDKAYQPAIDKMLELAPKVIECIEMEDGTKKTKLAKSLYSDYVSIRTTTHRDIHKVEKAKYTAQGKYCDIHKRTRDEIGGPIEAKLKEIKDAAKLKKEAEEVELQKFRENQISQYLDPTAPMIPDLGKMNEILWANLLEGTKATYELNNRNEADEAKRATDKADYQAETMRRYNLLVPLQKFITDENKKTYADQSPSKFNEVLLEAQALNEKAEKELLETKEAVKVLEEKVETVTKEKEVAVKENKSFNEEMRQKIVARRSGATDKEKMIAFTLDLKTIQERYTFTDPNFVQVYIQSNNYLSQLITNIESFNNKN